MRNIKVTSGVTVPTVSANRSSPAAKQFARVDVIFSPLSVEDAELITAEVCKDKDAPSELVVIALMWSLADQTSKEAFVRSIYLRGTMRRYMEDRATNCLKAMAAV